MYACMCVCPWKTVCDLPACVPVCVCRYVRTYVCITLSHLSCRYFRICVCGAGGLATEKQTEIQKYTHTARHIAQQTIHIIRQTSAVILTESQAACPTERLANSARRMYTWPLVRPPTDTRSSNSECRRYAHQYPMWMSYTLHIKQCVMYAQRYPIVRLQLAMLMYK